MPYNILVPTDSSETAGKAFGYALNIASRSKATIYLYHVYSPVESPFIETVEIRRDYNMTNEELLMAELHRLRATWKAAYPDVNIVTVLGRSPLVNSMMQFVKDKEIDLIVMGTQGATGIRKVVVGSIAGRILDRTSVPLLLVPERFEWRQPEKLVLATNYNEEDIIAMKLSGWLASLFDASIEVVHLPDVNGDSQETEKSFRRYVDELTVQAPGVSLKSNILSTYSVFDTLETLHEQIPYDVLVMVKHKKKFLNRLFMESCTKHMAYLTWHPLLVIPANEVVDATAQ